MLKRLFVFFGLLALSLSNAQAAPLLNAQEQAVVKKLQTYLDSIKTLKSKFTQFSSNGAFADGIVYLERPGKMRLIYSPPTKLEMIVRRGTIIHHDMEYKQVSYYPLSTTPLAILLEEKLDLSKDIQAVGLYQSPGVIELTLENQEDPGMGSVTLIFDDKPLALKKWSVTDAQGVVTSVALLDPVIGLPLGNDIFAFTDPQYDRQDN